MSAVIDHDVACLNCGYNLRGIDPKGDCPECGMRIAVALREDHLADAPGSWLKQLRGGAGWLLVGTLVSFPLLNVGPVIAAVGYWKLTVPQPGRDEPRHDLLVRFFSRFTLVPGAIGFAGTLNVLLYFTWRYRFGGSFDWTAYDSVLIGTGGYFGIGVAAMAQHLRTLAERAGDARLVARATRLFWAWIVGGFLLVVIGGLTNLSDYFSSQFANRQIALGALALLAVAALAVWLWAETLVAAAALRRVMKRLVIT